MARRIKRNGRRSAQSGAAQPAPGLDAASVLPTAAHASRGTCRCKIAVYTGFRRIALLLAVPGRTAPGSVSADDRSASAHAHDRVRALAGKNLLRICGNQDPAAARVLLKGLQPGGVRLQTWVVVFDTSPARPRVIPGRRFRRFRAGNRWPREAAGAIPSPSPAKRPAHKS